MATSLELFKKELDTLDALVAMNLQPGANARIVVLQELQNLDLLALTKPDIAQCHPTSIIAAIKTTLKQNLSLNPDDGLTYVTTRNIKTGRKIPKDGGGDKDEYIKVLEVKPTAN